MKDFYGPFFLGLAIATLLTINLIAHKAIDVWQYIEVRRIEHCEVKP